MLLFKKIFKTLTLDDLPSNTYSIKALRQQAPILIIEDKEFVYETGIRNAGFNITIHSQWNDIKDVEPYLVIVSDNHGVVNSKDGSDGLTMVNEGRKLYPDKKFALYSGNLLDIRDRHVEGLPIRTKGDSIDTWINMLDNIIKDCYNPKQQWETMRRILADSDITEKQMRCLQHYYVLSIIDKKCKIQNNWDINKDTLSLIIRIVGLAVNAAKLGIAL